VRRAQSQRHADFPPAPTLAESDERFRVLVDCIRDYAVFLLDTEGRVQTWNAGAALIKGYQRDEIVGKSIELFYSREDREDGRPRRLLAQATRDGRVEDEGWRVRKDGSRFWADVVITALRNDGGELIGFAKVTRDLTQRQQAEEERRRLEADRIRAEEALRIRDEFLSIASHELKTPLTALREGAELLNDQVGGPLAPPQRQVVSIMRDNSVKLQRLIEDLLDYQRALHAAASLVPRSVSLDALVREVAVGHELAMRAKGQQLVLKAEKLTVEADPEKLRSIVDNLLGNAVKFTPAGGSITVLAGASGGEAVIDVIDSGPGVPAEERDSIFDSFFRGRVKANARVEGTGLGLAIAREFTEAHGGKISVVSEGSGGHFRVKLPRKARVLEAA